jgi:toxin secretion/phage lysis holin
MPQGEKQWTYWVVQVAAASTWALWLKLPASIQALLLLQAIDIATGLMAAFINCGWRGFSSRKSFRGVGRKGMVLALCAACQIAGQHAGFPVSAGAWVACFFIVHEMISIIENAARSGVPVPPEVVDALLKFGRKRPED